MAVAEREPQTKIETSPGFSVQFAIEKCRTLSREAALATLTGDFKFQAWEITKIPLSDPFGYQIIETPEDPFRPKKLVFECDTETKSDIRDVTSKEWRGGKEYRAIDAWVDVVFAQDQELQIINKQRKDQGLEAEVRAIMQINPKKDPDDPTDTSNYDMSQVNVATINGSGKFSQQQLQLPADTRECATFFKKTSRSNTFNIEDIRSVDDMMMSFSVIEGPVSANDLLNTATLVTGKRYSDLETIERQKQEIIQKSRIAALKFYNNVKLGKSQQELTTLYQKLLGETIPSEFISQIKAEAQARSTTIGGGGTQMIMETSCGAVTLFGEESKGSPLSKMMIAGEKWSYTTGTCVREECKKENTKVGPCGICIQCEEKLS